jgi:hypothetical protein
MEEAMPETTVSAVSRILRLLALESSVDARSCRQGEEKRSETAAEIERKLAQHDQAFWGTWQYPGQ